jgi:ribosomal protein S18 acetylase RimI-like enzyme
VEVRPARADDVPAILALWRAAGLFPSTTDDAESVRGLLARDAEALLVAEIGGEVVGSICGTVGGATSAGLPSTPVTDEKASR